MNIRLLCAVLLLAGLFPAQSRAEEGEKFNPAHGSFFRLLLGEDEEQAGCGYLYQPGNEQKSGGGEFDLQQYQGRLDVPLPVERDLYFTLGGNYMLSKYDLEDYRLVDDDSLSLYQGAVRVGAGYFISDDLLFTGWASEGAYSDFEESPSGDAYRLHARALLVYRLNPGAQLLAGAAKDDTFEDTDYYPVAGVRLLSENGKIYVNLTLPLEAEAGYRFTPQFKTYVRGSISGQRYETSLRSGDGEARTEDKRLGIGALLWLGSHVKVGVEGGAAMDSKFELSTGSREEGGKSDPAPYVLGTVGLAL